MARSKRFYIKATDPAKRRKNLTALADKYWLGNFSRMLNDALDKVYNLNPDTGEELGGGYVAELPKPKWPRQDLLPAGSSRKPRSKKK